MKRTILLALILSFFAFPAQAQVSITQLDTELTETFDDFRGTGFTPSPTSDQLSSNTFAVFGLSDGDLSYGGAQTSGDFARGDSDGQVGTGGIYASETATGDYALGFQPGESDLTPGAIFMCFENQTGGDIGGLDVSYDVQYYNDQARSNDLALFYAVSNACETTDPSNVTTPFADASLSVAVPEAEATSLQWEDVPQSTTLNGLGVANGAFITLAFVTDDVSGSGSRPELALNDVRVTARATGPATLTVDDDGSADYTAIQAAIDAAGVGDVVEVAAGTYSENVTVDKELTLNGPNVGTPGADPGRSAEATINGFVALSASNVVFDGFDVSPPDAVDNQAEAVLVNNGADNVTVKNNIVRDFTENFGSEIGPFEEDVEGIVAFGGKVENGVADPVGDVTIERNLVQNIDGRDAEGGAVGISIQGYVSGATVRDNEILNVGMEASAFALGVAVRSTGNPGIEDDPENVSITNNTISDVLPLSTSGLDGVGLEFEPNKENNPITVESNAFTNTTLQVEDKTVSLNLDDILANNSFDRAVVIRDANEDVKNELGVQKIYSPIAPAVANASPGETVDVYAGTYAGDLTINKALTVRGASAGGSTSSSLTMASKSTAPSCTAGAVVDALGVPHGLTVSADDVTLENLCVTSADNHNIYTHASISNLTLTGVEALNAGNYGLEIHNNASVTGLSIINSTFSGNSVGMRIRGTVDGLTIDGSAFDHNNYGFYTTLGGTVTQELADGGSTNVSDVTITNTTFNDNPNKGIYAEKLDDATLKNIEVINSGTDVNASFFPQAIDINLKLKSEGYGHITVDNATVTGSIGEGLNVKARNDGDYAGDNATSLSSLTVKNSTFEGNRWGVVVGYGVESATITGNRVENNGADPDSYQQNQIDNRGGILFYANPSTADFDIETNCITGNATYGLSAAGAATVTASGNYWGDVSGPSGDFLGRGDAAFGDLTVDFSPEPVAACSGGATIPGDCEVTTLEETIDNPADGPGVITATFSNPAGILDVDFVNPDNNDEPVLENLVAQSDDLSPDSDGIKWTFTGSDDSEPNEVEFTLTQADENVPESRYFARVTSVCDPDGLVVNFDPVHTLKTTPAQFAVGSNYPNPFRTQTTVRLDLAEATDVTASIYDVMGRKVAMLVDQSLPAGSHDIVWQGRGQSGWALASGVYFMRLTAGEQTATRRLTIIR